MLQLHPCGFAEHLLGRIDFIWAGLVLHVLSKEGCQQFLSNACSLLKPDGSFYGMCAGQKEAGESVATPDGKARRFLHSTVTVSQAFTELPFAEKHEMAPQLCLAC